MAYPAASAQATKWRSPVVPAAQPGREAVEHGDPVPPPHQRRQEADVEDVPALSGALDVDAPPGGNLDPSGGQRFSQGLRDDPPVEVRGELPAHREPEPLRPRETGERPLEGEPARRPARAGVEGGTAPGVVGRFRVGRPLQQDGGVLPGIGGAHCEGRLPAHQVSRPVLSPQQGLVVPGGPVRADRDRERHRPAAAPLRGVGGYGVLPAGDGAARPHDLPPGAEAGDLHLE